MALPAQFVRVPPPVCGYSQRYQAPWRLTLDQLTSRPAAYVIEVAEDRGDAPVHLVGWRQVEDHQRAR